MLLLFRLEHNVVMFRSEHIVTMFQLEHNVIMFRLEHWMSFRKGMTDTITRTHMLFTTLPSYGYQSCRSYATIVA